MQLAKNFIHVDLLTVNSGLVQDKMKNTPLPESALCIKHNQLVSSRHCCALFLPKYDQLLPPVQKQAA